MDQLDDILDTSIVALTSGERSELIAAIYEVIANLDIALQEQERDETKRIDDITRRSVQGMSLIIAMYAQALERDEGRDFDDDEEQEEIESE